MHRWLFILCGILYQKFALPQPGYTQTVQKIIKWNKTAEGIEGELNENKFFIKAYHPQIIRIKIFKNKTSEGFSYNLTGSARPHAGLFTINQSANKIVLETTHIITEVYKEPYFRIVFKNTKGEILNADVNEADAVYRYGNKVLLQKQIQPGEKFIGLGEALGNANRRGSIVTLDNTDNYRYKDERIPMYSSIPFYMGIHQKNSYGLYFHNNSRATFNFGASTPDRVTVSFDAGEADYFFMYDSTITGILNHYTSITGRMELPPLWSLGYHQSRCSYYPDEETEWIAESFRKKKIPLDAIVLDAHYQNNYQPFVTNRKLFPNLPALSEKLKKQNIDLIASVHPGVQIDSGYQVYVTGMQKNIFLKYANGKNVETSIPPLRCYLYDFSNPAARELWKTQMQWMKQNGIRGYWNDMNEPAVAGSYIPENVIFHTEGRKASAVEMKNLYGMLMARSSYEAARVNEPDKRPFILTRSGAAGVQRYAALWSGDNFADDDGLLRSILLNNQLSISGVAFTGYDVGGYIGEPGRNVFTRWMQVGVFSPYCRNHREFLSTANEPWSYGKEAEAISRAFIESRYKLLPYLYSAFYEAAQTGHPVVAGMAAYFPHDDKVYDQLYQLQFFFGKNMLIVPVTSKEMIKKIYLPEGEWYDLYSDKKIHGPSEIYMEQAAYKIPVYIKASAIIPVQKTLQSTKEKPGDTLQIHVYYSPSPNTYQLYEDEGEGYNYAKGIYSKRNIIFNPAKQEIEISKQEGTYQSAYKYLQIVLHGFDNAIKSIMYNEKPVISQTDSHPIINPLQYTGMVYDESYQKELEEKEKMITQISFVITNQTGPIKIKWK